MKDNIVERYKPFVSKGTCCEECVICKKKPEYEGYCWSSPPCNEFNVVYNGYTECLCSKECVERYYNMIGWEDVKEFLSTT